MFSSNIKVEVVKKKQNTQKANINFCKYQNLVFPTDF